MGPCEFRLLNLMGARSKTFKRGSGHHTCLFENETQRYRLALDSVVRLLPLSDHCPPPQRNCHWVSKLAAWSFTSIPIFEIVVRPPKFWCRRIPKAHSPSKFSVLFKIAYLLTSLLISRALNWTICLLPSYKKQITSLLSLNHLSLSPFSVSSQIRKPMTNLL